MSANAAAAAEPHLTPIFDWTPPRTRRWALLRWVLASAALHALCFYVFQIIYPATVTLLPPPVRLEVITAATEEGRLLLRWIEAEDPALTLSPHRSAEGAALAPPSPAHVPSFAGHQPALRMPPPIERDLRVPSAMPPGPVPAPSGRTMESPVQTPTRFVFGDPALDSRAVVPAAVFESDTGVLPQSARFRVGIDAAGAVRYAFLESSSGDRALDRQARQVLMQTRFSPAGDGMSWSSALVEWGSDVQLPNRTPATGSRP